MTIVEYYSDICGDNCKTVDIVTMQVSMPTTDHDSDEIEKNYGEIKDILLQEGRGQLNAIVQGDFSTIVGE